MKEYKYKTYQNFGAHVRNCKQNPNLYKIHHKISKTYQLQKINYKIECQKCKKIFEVLITKNSFIKKYYNKCCSSKCAHSRIQTEEINNKRIKKLKGIEYIKREIRKCKICKKKFRVKETSSQITCGNRKCRAKIASPKLKGKTGGYKTKSGRSKFHGGYYNNMWMDSSWEIKFAKLLDKYNIKWERKNIYLYYNFNETKLKYYPDFYLPIENLYIELKGYWTDKVRNKMKLVLEQNKIKLIILEHENKFEEFIKQLLIA